MSVAHLDPSMTEADVQAVLDGLNATQGPHEVRLEGGVYDCDGSSAQSKCAWSFDDQDYLIRCLGPVLVRNTRAAPPPAWKLWRIRCPNQGISSFRTIGDLSFDYARPYDGGEQADCLFFTGSDVNVDDQRWCRGIDIHVNILRSDSGDGVRFSHRTEDIRVRGTFRNIARNPVTWSGKGDPSLDLRTGLTLEIDARGETKLLDLEPSQAGENFAAVSLIGCSGGRCHLPRTTDLLIEDCDLPRGILLGGQRGRVVIRGYTQIGADPIEILPGAQGPGQSGHPIGSNGAALALEMYIGPDVVLRTSPGSAVHPDTGVEYQAGIFSLTSPPSAPGEHVIDCHASLYLHSGQHVWDPSPKGRVVPGGPGSKVWARVAPEYLS